MTATHALSQESNEVARPPIWAALLAGALVLTGLPLHVGFVVSAAQKPFILAEGVAFLAAGVVALVWRQQMAEYIRRLYHWRAQHSVFGGLYRPLGGTRVTTVHRLLAVNFGCITVLWAGVCFVFGLVMVK